MTAEWGSVDLMMMNDGEGFHTIDNQQVRRTTTVLRTFPKKVMVVCRRRWLFCGAVVVFAFAMTRR
jgi:hypothetical protein